MDRDGDARLDERRRAGRALRVEVPGGQPRPPAPYRERRHVDATGQRAHLGEQVRVPGEVDAHRPFEEKPQGGHAPARRVPAAVVTGRHGLHGHPDDGEPIAGLDLDTSRAPPRRAIAAQPRGHDHRAVARHLSQRRRIEVVVMSVRNQAPRRAQPGPPDAGMGARRRMWPMPGPSTGSVRTRASARAPGAGSSGRCRRARRPTALTGARPPLPRPRTPARSPAEELAAALQPAAPPRQHPVHRGGADDRLVGDRQRLGMQDERLGLRPSEPAVEADQLLERAALVALGVVEAADHDVRDVREAVGAQEVGRGGRRERGQRILALHPPGGRGARAARARGPPGRAPRSSPAASPTCGCSRSAGTSCGWRSSISSSVSRRFSSIR